MTARALLLLALLGLTSPAGAEDRLIPVTVQTPGGFTAFEKTLDVPIPVDLSLPAPATDVVGWSGWVYFLQPATTAYMVIEWWVDGGYGPPWLLEQWVAVPSMGALVSARPSWTRAGTSVHLGGGPRVPRVFVTLYCAGVPSAPQPACAASATVTFRVPAP